MPNKIIFSIVILFILSSSFLAWSEKRQHQQSNQWFLSFQSPQGSDLSFVIENQNSAQTFHWEYWKGGEKVIQGDEKIKTNEKKSIHIPIQSDNNAPEKNIIKVDSEKQEKEIYKIF
ncbi:MAG: hypothetical protein M0P97_03305 [Candidatus Moranbacteria bacterium]|jgi:hypothetical protein|nr:hypothetical protein [Candidatus Moranbacteria bacterium]